MSATAAKGRTSRAPGSPACGASYRMSAATAGGANHPGTREPGVGEPEFHPMTMPDLLRWFRFLSARLRHVRILNGDWRRACTNGAMKNLSVRQGHGVCGVFVDPPYSLSERREVYAEEGEAGVAQACKEWAASVDEDPQLRIVLAGFDTEHADLEARGWSVREWFRSGFLKGGMGTVGGKDSHQQRRERLWLSPSCASAETQLEMELGDASIGAED